MYLSGTYGPGYKPKGPTGDQVVIIGGAKVKKRDIPALFDDGFIESYNLWTRWKRYGLPFSGGFQQQPGIVIDVLDAWEAGLNGRNTKTNN